MRFNQHSDDESGDNNDPGIGRDGMAQLAPLPPRPDPDLAPVPSRAAELNPAGAQRKGRRKWDKILEQEDEPVGYMYAELLEMQETNQWGGSNDRLPRDLDTGWVALAPVCR